MLPRKSVVVKYLFFTVIFITCTYLLLTKPEGSLKLSPWRRLMHELEMIGINETHLRIEFEQLKHQLNATYSSQNRTIEEIYQYVLEMRQLVPRNPHDFKYIINPVDICNDRDIFVLIYVHSAPAHHKRRTVIRETWGNSKNFPDLTIKVVFLMGLPKDSGVQEALLLESDAYADIIQEDFVDSYRNLTYKAIEGLKWTSKNCRHAKFILKTDDDIFVNIFNLVGHLKSIYEFRGGRVQNLLMCLVWYRMKVIRDPKSKWFIPKSEFKPDYFPTYCSGSAFVMSADVISNMYNASLYTPFFWVDDFYVTGLLASKINIVHEKLSSVYILGPSVFLEKFTEKNKWRTLVFGHVHNINHFQQVWKNIIDERNAGFNNVSKRQGV